MLSPRSPILLRDHKNIVNHSELNILILPAFFSIFAPVWEEFLWWELRRLRFCRCLLPVKWETESALPQHQKQTEKNRRLPRFTTLTASAATSLLLMKSGMVADWKRNTTGIVQLALLEVSINEPKFRPPLPPQEPPELSRNHPSEGTAEGRPQGCDRAPAQRSQGPELPFLPPPWGRGLPPNLHRGHAGEAEAPQRPQDTGAERHGQRLPAPLRHRLHPGPVPPPGPFPLTASGRGGAPPETRPAELWFRPCATPRGSPRYHKKIPFLREIAR